MPEPLRIVPGDEHDQVVRLARYRQAHPGVWIRDLGRGGIWQAVVPQPDGELVITRIRLEDLLDTLDALPG